MRSFSLFRSGPWAAMSRLGSSPVSSPGPSLSPQSRVWRLTFHEHAQLLTTPVMQCPHSHGTLRRCFQPHVCQRVDRRGPGTHPSRQAVTLAPQSFVLQLPQNWSVACRVPATVCIWSVIRSHPMQIIALQSVHDVTPHSGRVSDLLCELGYSNGNQRAVLQAVARAQCQQQDLGCSRTAATRPFIRCYLPSYNNSDYGIGSARQDRQPGHQRRLRGELRCDPLPARPHAEAVGCER